MTNQIGGLALKNFIIIDKKFENLSVPIGIHYNAPKNKQKINYSTRINNKVITNNLFYNLISLMKPSPFRQTKKNKIKLNKITRKNKKNM